MLPSVVLKKYLFIIYTLKVKVAQFSSVQFSHSVVSDSLRPHESQHTRPPCPSPTPWVHSDSRPLSQWCHPAISSSVVLFSSCPQSGHQSLFQWVKSSPEVAKVLEFQPQHHSFQWTPKTDLLEWTGWISLQSKGLSKSLLRETVLHALCTEMWEVSLFKQPNCQFVIVINKKENERWIDFYYFFIFTIFLISKGVAEDWQQKGTTEDEMVGWYHQLDGQAFEQAPRVGDG